MEKVQEMNYELLKQRKAFEESERILLNANENTSWMTELEPNMEIVLVLCCL